MSILEGFKKRKRYQENGNGEKQLLSYWTSSETVICDENDVTLDKTLKKMDQDINRKANIRHASESSEIGVGTEDFFGHVKTGSGISNYKGLISVAYGSSSETACEGNDARLNNARKPIPHTANSTEFGGGTSSAYGHVKLSDVYTQSIGNAGQSIGASQKSVFDSYQNSIVTASNNSANLLNYTLKWNEGRCSYTGSGGIDQIIAIDKTSVKYNKYMCVFHGEATLIGSLAPGDTIKGFAKLSSDITGQIPFNISPPNLARAVSMFNENLVIFSLTSDRTLQCRNMGPNTIKVGTVLKFCFNYFLLGN